MPVPATIDDLSTTASSNSPAGSETPTDGDNYIRTLSSFIALLRDKLNGTSNTGTVKNATFSGTTAGLRVPIVAYKPSNTSRTSTITVADDPHLIVALDVGAYAFQMWIPFWCEVTTGQSIRLQLGYTGTIGTPSGFSWDGTSLGATTGLPRANLTSLYAPPNTSVSSDGLGTNADVLFYTGLITTSTAGTLSLKWAQEESSINATVVGGGAWMTCLKVS